MDAFAVAICKGVCLRKVGLKQGSIVGGYFGLFQAGMPVIGYYLGTGFADKITRFDHWIAFVLLGVIGGKMFFESFKNEKTDCPIDANDKTELKFTKMVVLAVATSIDALAVGVTFAFLKVNIWLAAAFIGVTTFTLSACGVKIGHVFGEKFKSKAELAGGLILMLMGTKILLEHLGYINF
jgi:putative Mn2+ efflux pump MntP